MNMPELSTEKARQGALELFQKAPFASFATCKSCGQPNLRSIGPSVVEDDLTVWVATSKDSEKVQEIGENNKVTLYVCNLDQFSEARIYGTAEVLSDKQSRRKAWRDDYVEHFPEGVDSPDLCAIKITAHSGKYWTTAGRGGF